MGIPTLSKTFTSRSTAHAWARKAESDLERSVYLDLLEAEGLKLSKVLTRYSEEIAVTHRGWRQEQSRCKGLGERLGSRTLADLTPSASAEYREERLKKVSPKTVREELSLLQRVFNVCLKDLVRKPRRDNPRERRMSPEESGIISQVPIFNPRIETAIRRGEIAAMDWQHLDAHQDSDYVRDATGRSLIDPVGHPDPLQRGLMCFFVLSNSKIRR
jgi:integrase